MQTLVIQTLSDFVCNTIYWHDYDGDEYLLLAAHMKRNM